MLRYTRFRWVAAGLTAAFIAISSPAVATASGSAPHIRDLGTLGGQTSQSIAINDLGQVAGNSATADGTTHAFVWTHKRGMRDLGAGSVVDINRRGQVVGNDTARIFIWDPRAGRRELGALGGVSATATDLNDRGQIVGAMDVREGENVVTHAFRWDPWTGLRDLGIGSATAINASGQVAGEVRDGMEGFFWDPRTGREPVSVDLDPNVSSPLFVTGINNRGQVVGSREQAFLWERRTGGHLLNNSDALTSGARDINERGQVVGRTQDRAVDADHAFLWTTKTGMVDLTTGDNFAYASYASGINNAGQVVGGALTPSGPSGGEAFVWKKLSGLVYLGTLGGTSSDAVDVNEFGWIAGNSTNAAGAEHAVLWVLGRSHR